ncbi:MAG: N-acyl homoserine lactonase family protein [Cyclobacteriaceae bacterium]
MKIRYLFISIVVFCLLASCNKTTSKTETPDLQLYVFDVGEILIKDASIFDSGGSDPILLTNSAYLLRHPKGDLMWDTGFPDSLVALPDGLDSEMATIRMTKALEGQLSEIGLSPKDIEYLALSHLHPDHVGNANLFTSSTLLLQQEEYDTLFKSSEINTDVKLLQDSPYKRLDEDFDVFGDGTVIIKRAPGHTNGHQVLYIELAETGAIVLSGDLFITTKQREVKGVPVFNVNKEQTLETMNSIEAFIKERNATLWIQHDRVQNLDILRSPKSYK